MSDNVASAIITVGGMVSVAALTAFVQHRITKAVINNEHQKINRQAAFDAASKRRQWKNDHLLELLSELLGLTDPEINGIFQYPVIVRLVNKIHLLLDTRIPEDAELNNAIIHLALALRDQSVNRRYILDLHAAVSETSKKVIYP